MSVKRIYYVKHARQTYARGEVTGEIAVMRKDGTPKLGRGGRPMTRRVISKDKSRPNPLKVCGKCRVTINVGDPYLYWEPYFRSSSQMVRCMKQECFPRPSERESSLMQEVLAAQESVQDQIAAGGQESSSDFETLQNELSEAMESVIEQYNTAAEPFGDAGPNKEMAEELESQRDEVDGMSFEDAPERDELDGCEKAGGTGEDEHDEGNLEGCAECDEIYNEALNTWREEQSSMFDDLSIG